MLNCRNNMHQKPHYYALNSEGILRGPRKKQLQMNSILLTTGLLNRFNLNKFHFMVC